MAFRMRFRDSESSYVEVPKHVSSVPPPSTRGLDTRSSLDVRTGLDVRSNTNEQTFPRASTNINDLADFLEKERKQAEQSVRPNGMSPLTQLTSHNTVGDKGEKGDKGDTGEKGDRGERGPATKSTFYPCDIPIPDVSSLLLTVPYDGNKYLLESIYILLDSRTKCLIKFKLSGNTTLKCDTSVSNDGLAKCVTAFSNFLTADGSSLPNTLTSLDIYVEPIENTTSIGKITGIEINMVKK